MSETEKFFDFQDIEAAARAIREASALFKGPDQALAAEAVQAATASYDDLFNKLCRQIYEDVKDHREDPAEVMNICNHGIVNAEHMIASSFPDNYQIDCRKGCGHCCNFPVETVPQDIIQLALYLKISLSEAEFADLLERLRTDIAERSGEFMRLPCPLLSDEQSCSVYEHRPLPCRMFTSRNVEDCQQSVLDGRQISQRPLAYRVYQAGYTSLQIAAQQDKKFMDKSYMIPGLLELFTDGQELPQSEFYKSWGEVYASALARLQTSE